MSAFSWLAWSLLDIPELLISDFCGGRPRRSSRLITRRPYRHQRPITYHVHYHQAPLGRAR